MKVISIIQPWATLIALGEKRIETRSWQTKHRGPLLIHSSKKIDKKICEAKPFKSILKKHGYTAKSLPTGVILAKCNLKACLKVKNEYYTFAELESEHRFFRVDDYEYIFGDYTPGRYGWLLTDIQQLEPIAAKGQLGLWNFDGVE